MNETLLLIYDPRVIMPTHRVVWEFDKIIRKAGGAAEHSWDSEVRLNSQLFCLAAV